MEKKLSVSKETKQNKTTITKNTERKEKKKRGRKRGSSVRNRTRDLLRAGPRYVHRCHCSKLTPQVAQTYVMREGCKVIKYHR